MNSGSAIWLWSDACQSWKGDESGNLTALGGAALMDNVPLESLSKEPDRCRKVASFLRVWADAIEKEE